MQTRRASGAHLVLSVLLITAGSASAVQSEEVVGSSPSSSTSLAQTNVTMRRLPNNPLLQTRDQPGLEENINGPSVIEVPDWVDEPLGRYYLYFAHHRGKYIRLAHSDKPEGPFEVFEPGTLSLAHSGFPVDPPAPEAVQRGGGYSLDYPHIASPDVHVVPERREIRMYYHGLHVDGRQYTRVAVSKDGRSFEPRQQLLGPAYFRVFRFDGIWYALTMPGVIYRSEDGLSRFVQGPALFDPTMRHAAVLVRGHTLHVFYTRAGDAPESILHAAIDLRGDWREWKESQPTVVMRPEMEWEGADLPVHPSARGAVTQRVNQLRDPALLQHDGRVYLYYAIAGESGIGVARVSGLMAGS